MAKTNWQDPKTSEIRSTHISGLQEAVSKIEESIGISTTSETDIPLAEVFIENDDRCRIYQAPEGKRNWLLSPTPVIKKNGTVISQDFEIDYGGGAIIFSIPISESDVVTADATYTTSDSNKFETPAGAQAKAEAAVSIHESEADPHDQYALDTALEGHELDDTAHGIGAIAQAVDNLEQEVTSHKADNAVYVTKFTGVDKTGATDSSEGINNAFASFSASNRGTLYFPDGNYLVANKIIASPYCHIVFGENAKIIADESLEGIVFEHHNISGKKHRNINVLCSNTTNQIGLSIYNSHRNEFFCLKSSLGLVGIQLEQNTLNNFYGTAVDYADTGIKFFLTAGSGGYSNNANNFYGTKIEECTTQAVLAGDITSGEITYHAKVNNFFGGTLQSNGRGFTLGGSQSMIIEGIWFEANNYDFYASTGHLFRDIYIRNNYFAKNKATTNTGIHIESGVSSTSRALRVKNNIFQAFNNDTVCMNIAKALPLSSVEDNVISAGGYTITEYTGAFFTSVPATSYVQRNGSREKTEANSVMATFHKADVTIGVGTTLVNLNGIAKSYRSPGNTKLKTISISLSNAVSAGTVTVTYKKNDTTTLFSTTISSGITATTSVANGINTNFTSSDTLEVYVTLSSGIAFSGSPSALGIVVNAVLQNTDV